MKTTKIFPYLVLVLVASVGCSPKFYSPNTQNVPLLSEKGETVLNVSGNGNQYEFQAAHGVTNHIGLQASGGIFIPKDMENGNGGSGNLIEAGIGYYTPVAEKFVFETYALAGGGKMENHLPSTVEANPTTKGDVSANIFRYGIQPAFGYKSSYFSAAISSRVVNMMYNNISGDLIFEGEPQTDYLKRNSSLWLLEPALTLRGGLEKIKLQLQFGYSLNLTNNDFRQDNTFMTFGLHFNFGRSVD